jgi:hypothetical protein
MPIGPIEGGSSPQSVSCLVRPWSENGLGPWRNNTLQVVSPYCSPRSSSFCKPIRSTRETMRTKKRNVCQNCRSRKLAVSYCSCITCLQIDKSDSFLCKCDGKQPACSQCSLRQITCSGYRQEFVFVSQTPAEVDDHPGIRDERKKATDYVTKALVHPVAEPVWPAKSSPLIGHCELDGDIQIIIQHYAPANGKAPTESNSEHNQVCGAWVEVLPSLSRSTKRKPFLASAVKTLATTIRHYRLEERSSQPQILRMYCDSLQLLGEALKEAQGIFYMEQSIAIMCLAVTDVSNESGGLTVRSKLTENHQDHDPNDRVNARARLDGAHERGGNSCRAPWA